MSDVLLQTQGLGVSFGGVHAVHAVDFQLQRGEVRCLIGPNGAGKSTFFKMLSGQLRPSRGEIHFKGKPLRGLATHEVARLGIGIKTQVPSVFEGLDVMENLLLAAERRADGNASSIAAHVLAEIGLDAVAHTPVNVLAHGQRQWVELGMILASRPELVLLDEPAAGMTHQEVRKTAELIAAINRHSTVVVVEHDMEFIRMIAGRITVFNQGEVLAEGSFDEIMAHAEVRAAYLGKQGESHARSA
ncbi:ABC transporter ATP-binding protein [Bordetella tumbae]|uniref:ATP-binding cassette domain-containing protein n=1 Tax=Bordetella tumbae TaxID=1649139 RepID=UPI0039F0A2A8